MLRRLLSALGVYRLYRKWLLHQVEGRPIPEHVAVILDGNRRWAAKHRLRPWEGHRFGAEKAEEFLRWCLKLGVKTTTLYIFSTENFMRSREEVEELMELFEKYLNKLLYDPKVRGDIEKYRVRVKVIGRRDLLPGRLRDLVEKVEESTRHFDGRYLNLAIAYGGRAEIVDAAREIARRIKDGELSPEDVDEGLFEKFLYTSHLPNPDPDLIIRTSGEVRLSGFLLWQSAYSELCFIDVYWPDFREIDFLRAIRTYQQRVRRFGR